MVKLELSLIVMSMSTFLTEKLDPFTNHKVIKMTWKLWKEFESHAFSLLICKNFENVSFLVTPISLEPLLMKLYTFAVYNTRMCME